MNISKWQALTAWVKYGSATRTIVMGMLPGPCFVLTPFIGIPTEFDSGSSDNVKIGHADDDDAFGQSYDLQTAVDKANFTDGVEVGYRAAGKQVIITYTPSGSAASQGEAIVMLPFLRLPSP